MTTFSDDGVEDLRELKKAPVGTFFYSDTIWHGRHSVPTASSFLQETVSI
tara:strand:+ start:77 stop:226 length:150 start_codon:yes stop_codon:yes gene_type:complete